MSEIRQNRLTGEWVIIAPERAKRGGNLPKPAAIAEVPARVADCPFCPGNEVMTPGEGYRANGPDGQWRIRSVANKFSVLSSSGDVAPAEKTGHWRHAVNCVGLHEVLVESPRHDAAAGTLSVEHICGILDAYRQRFQTFYADPRVRHVIIFKNQGADAGASQQHPHSQIVGLPIVPGQVVERVEGARRFHAEAGLCLACTIIDQEREHGGRIIAENGHFIAFIPYAALSPYHLWIFPKVHGACFSTLPAAAWPALAEIVRVILAKVHGYLNNPPFNLVVRSLAPHESDAPYFHWYISIVPRVNKAAGFELGTGMYINPSLPESRAEALRNYVIPQECGPAH
jgi:UDPglucose--hexose-1-phosphate uridylyltransferase